MKEASSARLVGAGRELELRSADDIGRSLAWTRAGALALRRSTLLTGASAAAALAFGTLALLVALGGFDPVDSYVLHHLMPWFPMNEPGRSFLGSLLSYHGRQFRATLGIGLPAAAITSSALLVLGCMILWRRGDRRAALLWLCGFGLATVVELVSKSVVARPALYATPAGELHHVADFDASFPSGHVIRGVLLAAFVAYAWPSFRWLGVVWLAALVLALELNGVHTSSDILGGLLLAWAVVIAVLLLTRRNQNSPSPHPAQPGTSCPP